jgi:hypothetical protein
MPSAEGPGFCKEEPMAADRAEKTTDRDRFRKTLVRVLVVQVVTLVLLWVVQTHYNVM